MTKGVVDAILTKEDVAQLETSVLRGRGTVKPTLIVMEISFVETTIARLSDLSSMRKMIVASNLN